MRPPRRADPASCFKGDLASSRSTHDCSLPRKPHRSSKTSVAPHHEGHVLKGVWGKPGELCFCPSCSSHFSFLRPHSLTDSSPSPSSRDMTSKNSVTFLRKTFHSPSHTFLACLLLHCRLTSLFRVSTFLTNFSFETSSNRHIIHNASLATAVSSYLLLSVFQRSITDST